MLTSVTVCLAGFIFADVYFGKKGKEKQEGT